MEPDSPGFEAALAALRGKVTNEEFESLIARQLRDSGLAAPALLQVEDLQAPLRNLVDKIKQLTVISFDGDIDTTGATADVLKAHIAQMLKESLDAVLREWVIEHLYIPRLVDSSAFLDHGLGAALLSDIDRIRSLAGLPPLPKDIQIVAINQAIALSAAILDTYDVFVPPNHVRMAMPEMQAYARNLAIFPNYRHTVLANSPATKSIYSDFLAKYLSEKPALAEGSTEREKSLAKQRNIAIGLGVLGILGTYLMLRNRKPTSDEMQTVETDMVIDPLAIEQQEYYKQGYARTDWPNVK